MGEVLYFGKEPKRQPDYGRRAIHVMLPKGYHTVKSGIYILRFNEYFYIGRANNMRTRAKTHMKDIDRAFHYKNPKGRFQENILKFLDDNPTFSIIQMDILEECNEYNLNATEQKYLDLYKDDPFLMNIAKIACRTYKDVARSNYKSGFYSIEFSITSLNQLEEYKKLCKIENVTGYKFIRPFG